jgi:Uncharacterized conserved protein
MENNIDFNQLESSINSLNLVFEENTAKAINRNVTARNWLIGFYIVNYEQNGKDRAKYGDKVVRHLADRLNRKSLSYRNLMLYRQFYLEFKALEPPIFDYVLNEFKADERLIPTIEPSLVNCAITDCTIGQTASAQSKQELLESNLAIGDCQIVQTASAQLKHDLAETNLANSACQIQAPIGQSVIAQFDDKLQIPPEKLFSHLSFTHFSLILSVENPLARVFYELETIKSTWSVRELKRQIQTNYFERSAISRNPEKMSRYIQSGSEKMELAEIVKSPFVYEFLGMKDSEIIEESDLEEALVNHLEKFILELGNGFCFETRQKRFLIDDDYFFCDLVFYHRILKCHVLIDLKAKKIKYDDIAQMNLYLSYYRHNIMQSDDNPPIGILMCTEAGKELVKYATDGIDANLFIQKYKLNLPSEEKLTEWLRKEIEKEARK